VFPCAYKARQLRSINQFLKNKSDLHDRSRGKTAFSAEESDTRYTGYAVSSLIHAAIRPLLGIAFVVLYFDSKTGNDRS